MTEFTTTLGILKDECDIPTIEITVSRRDEMGIAEDVKLSVNIPLYPKCMKSRPSLIDRVRKAWTVLTAKPDYVMSRTVTISNGSDDIKAVLMQCIKLIDGN